LCIILLELTVTLRMRKRFPEINRIVTSQAYKLRCVESYMQDSCLPILGKPVSDWSRFCLDWCPAFISEATVKMFNRWGW